MTQKSYVDPVIYFYTIWRPQCKTTLIVYPASTGFWIVLFSRRWSSLPNWIL